MSVSVLIVDDEPTLNELFVTGLTRFGYETRGVLGGEECLVLLKNIPPPDLILLDMMMEPMDGLETLFNLKEDPVLRKIPVILQTGKNLTYKEAEELAFLVADYIMKPITPRKCRDHITEVIQRSRELHTFVENSLSSGYGKERIIQVVRLYSALRVSERMGDILKDRYHLSKGDSFGLQEYTRFVCSLRDEYQHLKGDLNPPGPSFSDYPDMGHPI